MVSVGNRHSQRGVALITVLLVFVIVAVIATEMLRRSQLTLRSVASLIETRQAYYYALGGEVYARQLLARDMNEHAEVDTLTEAWAKTKEQQPFAIDNGEMQIEIYDLQGRFNLNSLLDNAQSGQINPDAVARFENLLAALQLSRNYAALWRDWIDRDQQASANGAEDADYSEYRTASAGAEADVSALRLLRSMTPADYAKLAPHVAALPPETGLINVNTASAEVLKSISPTLSESQLGQIETRQRSGGYRDLGQVPGLNGASASLTSNFFEVVITVNYANRWQRVRTVLQRRLGASGQVELVVLSRVRSPLIDDLELEP